MNDPRPVILFDGDCNFCNAIYRSYAHNRYSWFGVNTAPIAVPYFLQRTINLYINVYVLHPLIFYLPIQ